MLRSHFGHHPVATNKTHSVKHCLYISMCDWIDFNQLCDCPETLNISKISFDFEKTAKKKKCTKRPQLTTGQRIDTVPRSSPNLWSFLILILSHIASCLLCIIQIQPKWFFFLNYTLLFFSHIGYRNVLVFDSTETQIWIITRWDQCFPSL